MFAYSLWLWIPRRSFLMSFIMCSSHVHRLSTEFTKQNAATFTKQNAPPAKKAKSDDLRRQYQSRRDRRLVQKRLRDCVRSPDVLISGSEIVKSDDIGNQYWKRPPTTGQYNGKSHLAWDLVFTILLSRTPHGPGCKIWLFGSSNSIHHNCLWFC